MPFQGQNLTEWLDYIESIHPESIELGLERVKQVFHILFPTGVPYAVITVGGTNGKGSCCAYIESILLACEQSVGKYTSPHLQVFNERVHVAGAMIDDQPLVDAFTAIEQARGEVVLTYFEYTTLAAMIVFADRAVDVAVFEVGLGGRLDAVNILDPIVSVITSIGLDHIDWLGSDRETIGKEKVAIARTGKHCIVGDLDVPVSVMNYLNEIDAISCCINHEFSIKHNESNWQIDGQHHVLLSGLPVLNVDVAHQYRNAACAALAVLYSGVVVEQATEQVAIRRGLANTVLKGRCQMLSQQPYIIADVAHNTDSVLALCQYLKKMTFTGRCYAVFSMLNDKDLDACVALMFDVVDEWHIAALQTPRANTVEGIQQAIIAVANEREKVGNVVAHQSIEEAFYEVKKRVNSDDCVIVFGSFHVVGDIIPIN